MSKPFYPRLRTDEGFDEVRIRTIPRFKSSGLTGSMWRTSVEVQLLRKGRVLQTAHFANLRTAAAYLSHLIGSTIEHPDFDWPKDDHEFCQQPGCSEKKEVEFALSSSFCEYCSECTVRNLKDEGMDYRRGFCKKHAYRGDQHADDSDRNYTVISGEPPKPGDVTEEDLSESVFGGAVEADDL
jgi:hypothetical protein